MTGEPGIRLELFQDAVEASQLALDLPSGISLEEFGLESRQVDLQLAHLAIESLSLTDFLQLLDLSGAGILGFLGVIDALGDGPVVGAKGGHGETFAPDEVTGGPIGPAIACGHGLRHEVTSELDAPFVVQFGMAGLGGIPAVVLTRDDETLKFGFALAWTGKHLPVSIVLYVFPALVDDGILVEEKVQFILLDLHGKIFVAPMHDRFLVHLGQGPKRSVLGNRQLL